MWTFAAMLLIAPLVIDWRNWRTVTRRGRTWAVMMATGMAAFALPPLQIHGQPPFWVASAYVAIDLFAGLAVLRPKPAGCAQRMIGALFACMAIFDIVFFISSNGLNVPYYVDALRAAGWVQFVCLFLWGGWNVGKAYLGDAGDYRAARPDRGIAR
jgi:hypothetical protein